VQTSKSIASAAAVDGVLAAQVGRLKQVVETGSTK